MNLYDIMGPVMAGPSSSHTAGAARIGLISRSLLGEEVKKAEILLHGSFLATGTGHGTDLAIMAGLLGMSQDAKICPGREGCFRKFHGYSHSRCIKDGGVQCVYEADRSGTHSWCMRSGPGCVFGI